MIRTSTAIATAAIALSLLLHFLGLTFGVDVEPERSGEPTTQNVVNVTETFEDVAEAVVEPVLPEPAPTPDPPAETPPEPDYADVPTSDVRVASEDPQNVFAPDTGLVEDVPKDLIEPLDPTGGGSAPEAVEATGTDDESIPQAPTATQIEPPSVEIAAVPPIAETLTPDNAPIVEPSPPAEPVVDQAVPLEQTAITPDGVATIVEPIQEDSEIESPSEASDLAVLSSLRPRLRPQATSERDIGPLEFLADPQSLQPAPTETIESPITLYARDGINLFAGQNGGQNNGSGGAVVSRGPGNSDETNYVGRVLVHLNRTPVAPLTAKGSARVFFEINPDGSVARVDILDSTGSEEIERAARDQVLRAAPFPLPPQGRVRRLGFMYRSN